MENDKVINDTGLIIWRNKFI